LINIGFTTFFRLPNITNYYIQFVLYTKLKMEGAMIVEGCDQLFWYNTILSYFKNVQFLPKILFSVK